MCQSARPSVSFNKDKLITSCKGAIFTSDVHKFIYFQIKQKFYKIQMLVSSFHKFPSDT